MDTFKKTGGAAFPVPETRDANGCGIQEGWPGMWLRDWFAGHALVALETARTMPMGIDEIADMAYKYADAMLARREQ